MIWVYMYKEPVHNIPQTNNIDNEANKKIRNDFYWVGRYVNCILKPSLRRRRKKQGYITLFFTSAAQAT